MDNQKTVIFNPTGFLIKMAISIVMVIYFLNNSGSDKGILDNIFGAFVIFVTYYCGTTVLGFAIKMMGNLYIGLIFCVILLLGLMWVISYFVEMGEIQSKIVEIVIIVGAIWIPVRDIRKAIYFYKNTI